jgi:hypothetical protein
LLPFKKSHLSILNAFLFYDKNLGSRNDLSTYKAKKYLDLKIFIFIFLTEGFKNIYIYLISETLVEFDNVICQF